MLAFGDIPLCILDVYKQLRTDQTVQFARTLSVETEDAYSINPYV